MGKIYAILQTGRLGDLWYTAPLARHLTDQGHTVEVVYDESFGNPFAYFPYIVPRPVKLPRYCKKNVRWGHVFNEAVWQLNWRFRLKREGREVIWNEVFPFRWLQAHRKQVPYIEYWYRNFPQVDFRQASTSLEVANDKTILVFQASQSVSFSRDQSYYNWIFGNLKTLVEHTGYKPLIVAYGDQPDHPEYDTWRGSLDEYQQLVARCGIVYGIITSSHVLGQLLGKPIVALYRKNMSVVDTIGGEDAVLYEGEQLNHQLSDFNWKRNEVES